MKYRRLTGAMVAFAPWATFSAPPEEYYSSAENLAGNALKEALHNIIDHHTVIPYSRTDEVMRVVDASPNNQSQIDLIYSTFTMASSALGASGENVWNREHVWPRSYGIGTTGADNSDLHLLFPCNAAVNTARGNKFFDWSDQTKTNNSISPENTSDQDSWEPSDLEKGRIARAILYAAVRYDGSDPETEDLELADIPHPSTFRMGVLSTILD